MARLPDAVYAEGSLAFLELYLDIGADQRAAWDRFASVMRDGIDALAGAREYDGDEALSAPQTVARLEASAQAGLIVFGKIRAAFDAFYADITDPQRRRLDELFSRADGGWWPAGYAHRRHAMCPRARTAP